MNIIFQIFITRNKFNYEVNRVYKYNNIGQMVQSYYEI